MIKTVVKISMTDGTIFEISDNLISFDCSENSKDSNLSPQPCVIEQNASVTFYDKGDIFRKKVQAFNADFFMGSRIEINAINNEVTNNLGIYLLSDMTIDGTDRNITVKGIDKTYSLDNVYTSVLTLKNRTVKDFLDEIFDTLPGESYSFWDNETEERCNNISLVNSFLQLQTAKNALNKVCALGMINIFYKDGIFRVVNAI